MITSGDSLVRVERALSLVLLGQSFPPSGVRIALYQLSGDGDARLLQDFVVSEPPSRDGVRELADKIDLEAREDAESLGWHAYNYRLDVRDKQTNGQIASRLLR